MLSRLASWVVFKQDTWYEKGLTLQDYLAIQAIKIEYHIIFLYVFLKKSYFKVLFADIAQLVERRSRKA
jgi:hypothetical protein